MKVGFLIGNMSHTGGTERVLQQIANGLADREYQIVIISMWGDKTPVFPLDKRIKRYRLGEEYPKGFGRNIKNIISLYRIIKKEQIKVLVDVDLILILYSFPVKIMVSDLKLISWEHFNYYHRFRKNGGIREIARRLSAKYSDILLVISKKDKYFYNKNLKICGKLCQIYNPTPYRNIINERMEEKVILSAGRLTKEKGFDYLLQSWEILENDFPEWHLCIVGDGEERETLLDTIKEKGLKSVRLPGYVKDIESYYKRCAFFVLPSTNEAFGMVLVEAMAYGKPVVSFDCKTGPGEIISDGKDGFLVPTGDYRRLAAKMHCLMESEGLRERMGKKAKESVKRFDIESILGQWEELLKTVI